MASAPPPPRPGTVGLTTTGLGGGGVGGGGGLGGLLGALRNLAAAVAGADVDLPTARSLVRAALSLPSKPPETLLGELLAGVAHLGPDHFAAAEGGGQFLLTCVVAATTLAETIAVRDSSNILGLHGHMRGYVEKLLSLLVIPAFTSEAEALVAVQPAVAACLGDLALHFHDGVELSTQLLQLVCNSLTQAMAAKKAEEVAATNRALDIHHLVDAGEEARPAGSVDGWCVLAGALLAAGRQRAAAATAERAVALAPAAGAFFPPLLTLVLEAAERGEVTHGPVAELLQALFAFQLATPGASDQTVAALWKVVQERLASGQLAGLRVGVGLTVRFAAVLVPLEVTHTQHQWALYNVLRDPVFWYGMKRCLVDNESLVRKQAMWVLHRVVTQVAARLSEGVRREARAATPAAAAAAAAATTAPGAIPAPLLPWITEWLDQMRPVVAHWDTFVLLYHSLDNFAAHLIDSVWSQMDQLHPPKQAAQDGTEAEVAVAATAAAVGPPLDFSWTSVLWHRGLLHSNIPVRRMILASFHTRAWTKVEAAAVPIDFLTGPLRAALGEAVQHREFGERPDFASEVTAGAVAFHALVFSAKPRPQVWGWLIAWLEEWTDADLPSRAGVAAFVACLEGAVEATGGPDNGNDADAAATDPSADRRVMVPDRHRLSPTTATTTAAERLLEALVVRVFMAAVVNDLRMVFKHIPQHDVLLSKMRTFYGAEFKAALHRRVVKVAATLARPPYLTLKSAANVILLLPKDALRMGMPLRTLVTRWLTPGTRAADPYTERTPAELLAMGVDPSQAMEIVAQQRLLPVVADGSPGGVADDRWLVKELLSTMQLFCGVGAETTDAARVSSLSPVTDYEVQAWRNTAARLAFLASLVVDKLAQVEIVKLVQQNLGQVYRRSYQPYGWREKVLLLTRALVAESFQNSLAMEGATAMAMQHISRLFNQQEAARTNHMQPNLVHTGWWLASSMQRVVKECLGELVAQAEAAATTLHNPWTDLSPPAATAAKLRAELAVHTLVEAAEWRFWWLTPGAATVESFLWRVLGRFGERSVLCPDRLGDTPAPVADEAKEAQEIERYSVSLEVLGTACEALRSRERALGSHGAAVEDATAQYPYHCLPVDAREAAASVRRTLEALCTQVETAERRAVLLRKFNPEIHRTLVVRKWRALRALLSMEMPDGAAWSGKIAAEVMPSALVGDVLAHTLANLETADESDMVVHLQVVRTLLPVALEGGDEVLAVACKVLGHDSAHYDANLQHVVWALVRGAWTALTSCKKKRLAAVAAFMSTCLHPDLFKHYKLHGYEADGVQPLPLTWAVEKVFAAGQKQARILRIAAMQLTGLWLQFPLECKSFYVTHVRMLALYGVAPGYTMDQDLDEELAYPDAVEEWSLLPPNPDPDLAKTYENSEHVVRVTTLQFIAQLAAQEQCEGPEHAALRMKSGNLGRALLLDALKFATTDPELTMPLYKKGSATHRRKIRLWQFLCTLTEFIQPDMETVIDGHIWKAMDLQNQPTVRQYVELFAIRFIAAAPAMLRRRALAALLSYNGSPPVVGSYMRVVMCTLIQARRAEQAELLPDVAAAIFPWMTIHHHNLRAFSHVVATHLLDLFDPVTDAAWAPHRDPLQALLPGAGGSAAADTRFIAALRDFLRENADVAKLRNLMQTQLDFGNPAVQCTPRGILSVGGGGLESAPVPLFDRVAAFLGELRQGLRSSMASDQASILSQGGAVNGADGAVGAAGFQRKIPSALQTVSVAGRAAAVVAHNPIEGGAERPGEEGGAGDASAALHCDLASMSLDDAEHALLQQTADRTRSSLVGEYGKTRRQDLIVVASLIDKVPNLAGLARTCEVFQAAGFAVANADVTKDPEFKNISVTAEKWVPIIEVAPSSLAAYLTRKRDEGWSLVGLEQTTTSKCITQYPFPEKTVLLLGREKEGVPVELLQLLDACVEIPQLGMIRSLNVHVSAAIAMYQYTARRRS